ncbi:aliphatic sulfonate ABC transporter substrate-binding protein [Aeribacillus composti]|uniref:aliphatic sulfonate ABC transporter substrate-binding protein n=1 Tax=Aeribacillus composti TaxID=1868734 RepID=UPI002E1DE29C|nr:aliphatic sulfonate ABC transporter substrate-binding protein [Aeribacillus composti]
MHRKGLLLTLISIIIIGILSACGANQAGSGEKTKVTIGYFPNIDHVPAMIAKEKGYYQEELGDQVKIEYKTFPDGGAFMTALKTGEIDAGLVGPGPVMNNFSNGADVKIIAGASSGGTVVVASPKSGIQTLKDIENKTFITPGVGCTHDVQFETYLQDYNIASSRIGGTLKHTTGNPAQYQSFFEAGKVDLAAVPEPWASLLIKNGAKVIVDTKDIAFGTTLPNTVLVTSDKFIKEHKELVQDIVNAHKKAIDFINQHPNEARDIAIKSIKETTNQQLDPNIIDSAWKRVHYTTEVDGKVLQEFADSSYQLKFLKERPDLTGLVDDTFLN